MTTLCAAFQRVSAVAPDAVALRDIGDARTLTWRAYGEQVRDVAAGLAGIGVGHGDTVALMMSNRIEFYPIDVGANTSARRPSPSTTRRHPKPSSTSSPIPVRECSSAKTGTWIPFANPVPHSTRSWSSTRNRLPSSPAP